MHFDLVSLELCFQLKSQLLECPLRACIGGHAWDGLLSDGRVTDQCDSSALSTVNHSFGDRVYEVKHGEKVQVHMMVVRADVTR